MQLLAFKRCNSLLILRKTQSKQVKMKDKFRGDFWEFFPAGFYYSEAVYTTDHHSAYVNVYLENNIFILPETNSWHQ